MRAIAPILLLMLVAMVAVMSASPPEPKAEAAKHCTYGTSTLAFTGQVRCLRKSRITRVLRHVGLDKHD